MNHSHVVVIHFCNGCFCKTPAKIGVAGDNSLSFTAPGILLTWLKGNCIVGARILSLFKKNNNLPLENWWIKRSCHFSLSFGLEFMVAWPAGILIAEQLIRNLKENRGCDVSWEASATFMAKGKQTLDLLSAIYGRLVSFASGIRSRRTPSWLSGAICTKSALEELWLTWQQCLWLPTPPAIFFKFKN